jgi:hypothetical protein
MNSTHRLYASIVAAGISLSGCTCSETDPPTVDGSTLADSGTRRDAGDPPDASGSRDASGPRDAATVVDAGCPAHCAPCDDRPECRACLTCIL